MSNGVIGVILRGNACLTDVTPIMSAYPLFTGSKRLFFNAICSTHRSITGMYDRLRVIRQGMPYNSFWPKCV